MYNSLNKNLLMEKFTFYRKECGLTQKEVEKLMGFRSLKISDFESGRSIPTLSVTIELCNLYKCTLENILGIQKDESQIASLKRMIPLIQIGVFESDLNLYNLIYDDPIIKAQLSFDDDKKRTLFQRLLSECDVNLKLEVIIELSKLINSVIGADKKISKIEIDFRDFLIDEYKDRFTKQDIKEIKSCLVNEYTVDHQFFKDNTFLKHLTIWILFFTALSDKYFDHRELEYIEKVARDIKIKKSHYDFILGLINEYLKRS
jgi:transcriptional regulator with XRE-family HTH domain